MSKIIRGDRPRSFPIGAPQCFQTVKVVYGKDFEGRWEVVPTDQVLVIPEYEGGSHEGQTIRHQFPAGTRFRVVRAGNHHLVSITEVEV